MNLRAPHQGYAYQDLLTGIALVDLILGTAVAVTVDTKGFDDDRFDDLNIVYLGGRRVRVQIKHTALDRELSKKTFSADKRSLKLDKLFDSLLRDISENPATTYRVVVRDGTPEEDLAKVLRPVAGEVDQGDPLPGVTTRRFQFDPPTLRADKPWKRLVQHLSERQLQTACTHLIIDTDAPASTLDFTSPGPAERVLLRRVVEELGAGRVPNTDITPEHAALALAHAATGARALDGAVARSRLVPQVGLTTDFGAVVEGHPVEAAVEVRRLDAAAELSDHVDAVIHRGGTIVVVGEPGAGKSWLCEQLAAAYRDADWIVARHHCWLNGTDDSREERVRPEIVIGSLLYQLEQLVPEATAALRPRFAATEESLAAAVRACRVTHDERNVLLIVDGLDHVDRVLGRRTNQQLGPSRLLVDQLLSIDLPPGVCMIIASQPGPHLENADPAIVRRVQTPSMSWSEIQTLTIKHGLIDESSADGPVDLDDRRRIADLVYDRSRGNALYATYLCRYATRVSPLDTEYAAPLTAKATAHRLTLVPGTATDLDAYYTYLLDAMTADQKFAVGTLALCGFALSADELSEMFPLMKGLLAPALQTLAPVLNSQPGLGGLRIHHESFSRHILRSHDDQWVTAIRESIAAWLSTRGFFMDARSFRHLPELLAQLGRYQELRAMIRPGFVADAIRAFQPPEALMRVVGIVARESRNQLDWPTLLACVETRKSIDTYESESLSDSIVEYGDVVVKVLGADLVTERLVYEGRPTLPSRLGLRMCRSVDRAGAAAPWKVYTEAFDRESEKDHDEFGGDHDGSLQLAVQLGALRLRSQHGESDPAFTSIVAEHLEHDHDASLEDLTEVFTTGLPAALMPDIAAAMSDLGRAARVYLKLADLSAAGTPGLPDPTVLAQEAWKRAPSLEIIGCLLYGIPVSDVLSGLGTTDLYADLRIATDAVLSGRTADHNVIRRWLALLSLAQAVDRAIPAALEHQLSGIGFFRAWMRFAVATVGLADDVTAGVKPPTAASRAVLVALTDLASAADPFTGVPRACDLYFAHPLIHETIEKSLVVVQPGHLKAVLDHLIAIGDGTTTSIMGLAENGPLATNDLLAILSRVCNYIGVGAIHALVDMIRERRNDDNTQYRVIASFELTIARICHAAGAIDEARECWNRAGLFLAGYGGHKDPTINEIMDSVEDVAAVDIDSARVYLGKLVDLTYLVWQHTDGRDTSHFVNSWWSTAAIVDPTAAARDGADLLLTRLGFEDSRVYSAHTHLLENHIRTADPVVLAALRLTAGMGWRRPDIDLELLTRLRDDVDTRTAAMLAIVANNIAASYDEQAMMYSSDQSQSVTTSELVDTIIGLGGPQFEARTPRVEKRRYSRDWGSNPRPAPTDIQQRLVNDQRPVILSGRMGAVLAARDYQRTQFRADSTTPRWDIETLANAVGWRILEAAANDGAAAAVELIDDVAREFPLHSDNDLFAIVGEGLAVRCGDSTEELKTVASYCLTLAYIRIRSGGWSRFEAQEQTRLWTTAYDLDPSTAERTLATAVAAVVDADAYRSYGVSRAVIAAFAAHPTGTPGGRATDCWDAVFSVIEHRLPGKAKGSDHVYRPTASPDSLPDRDRAMATLALATISQPLRADLRQTLLATTLLILCRPAIGQAALAHVLESSLDAGRTTWLLDVARTYLPNGELNDELAAVLTRLASADRLSVRALAGRVLEIHDRPIPPLPTIDPAPKILAAFQTLSAEEQQ
jgi:energy-coupling factor transporter ATP-binding protein EcfA2